MTNEFETKIEASRGSGNNKKPPTICGVSPNLKPGDIVVCCIKKYLEGGGYFVVVGQDGFLKTNNDDYKPGEEVIAQVSRINSDGTIVLKKYK